MGLGDLSDDQWAVLEPLLPVAGVGRPARSRRRLVDGIRWRVRTGAPWRDVPPEYGTLADDLRPVPPLAASGRLAVDPGRPAGAGRRGRDDRLGGERRLHDLSGPPARGRSPTGRRRSEGAAGQHRRRARGPRAGSVAGRFHDSPSSPAGAREPAPRRRTSEVRPSGAAFKPCAALIIREPTRHSERACQSYW
ncbi:transposase, partial [Streptomyces roseolus]|uniref:transposase n=1 Tax=Streptomyces roseolus TaxID=67358 RepID=UPI00364910D1